MFIGTAITPAIASDSIGLASDAADRYYSEVEPNPESLESEGEVVSGECPACQPQPLPIEEGTEEVITESTQIPSVPGCNECKRIIDEAKATAKNKTMEKLGLTEEELAELLDKIDSWADLWCFIMGYGRLYIVTYLGNLGVELVKKLDELPFNIFEALLDAKDVIKYSIIQRFIDFKYVGLVGLKIAISNGIDYIKALCNGEEPPEIPTIILEEIINAAIMETMPASQPVTQPASQPVSQEVTQATMPEQSGTMSL